MARQKAAVKKSGASSRKDPGRRSWWRMLGRLLVSTPVRQLLLLAATTAVLFWQWPRIAAAAGSLFALFGWGLLFILLAVLLLLVLIFRRKPGIFFRNWYRWVGGVAFVMAAWGILAFFALGGSFGRDIISYDYLTGILRVLGLLLLGVLLVAPLPCWNAARGFTLWLGRQFQRRRASARQKRAISQQAKRAATPALPVAAAPAEDKAPAPQAPRERRPVTPPEEAPVTPAAAAPKQARDLRQVAQEIWKKYGQSPTLVTVDGWRLPPLDILDISPEMEFSEADNRQRAQLIENSLASYGVDAKVVQINAGPTVTQFGVEPGWDRKYKELKERDRDGNIKVSQQEISKTRVKVERITSLANDLALALAAPSIRIEAPIPGKSVVGIEVPNISSNMVSLRGVVETTSFQKMLSKSRLALALGKGAGGEAVSGDLTKMPHLLIAGATGSGKTVCLNTIICCLLMHNTPVDVRLILVDPKRVELTPYNGIPHLAVPVIVDAPKAVSALHWLSKEMNDRYQKFAGTGARNIEAYNKGRRGKEKLPYLVLVIDELADLMMAGFDEVENVLCRLAQLARATGIHLIVATQRPSVDVVTGLIKANFPTRISFAVTSQVDSRTILDGAGAEKLLGKGDMLYMPTEAAKPKRLQGCFLSDAEMERLVYFWSGQQWEEPAQATMTQIAAELPAAPAAETQKDPLLAAALKLREEHQNISSSFLQRRLHIGYPRAARLMEQVEEEQSRVDKGKETGGDTGGRGEGEHQ